MSGQGKHAPDSPGSFYSSIFRHAVAGAAVVAVVVLVVALATSDDGSTGIAIQTPTATSSATETASASPTASASATPTRPPRAREDISIVVLNGTNRTGLATRTKERLVAGGYTVVRVGNTDSPAAKTVAYYRPGALPEATLLLGDFEDLVRIRKGSGNQAAADALITVVLGADYRA